MFQKEWGVSKERRTVGRERVYLAVGVVTTAIMLITLCILDRIAGGYGGDIDERGVGIVGLLLSGVSLFLNLLLTKKTQGGYRVLAIIGLVVSALAAMYASIVGFMHFGV